MRTSTFISEEKLILSAIDALIKKLGPVETNRFLSLKKGVRTESVMRHHLWQKKLDKDKFFNATFKLPHKSAISSQFFSKGRGLAISPGLYVPEARIPRTRQGE